MKVNKMKGLSGMVARTETARRVLSQLKMSGTFMTVSRKIYRFDLFFSTRVFTERFREALVEKIENSLMIRDVDFEADWFSVGNTLNVVIRTDRIRTVVSVLDSICDEYDLAEPGCAAAAVNLGKGWRLIHDIDECEHVEVDTDGEDLFLCYGEGLGAKTMRIRASLPLKKVV